MKPASLKRGSLAHNCAQPHAKVACCGHQIGLDRNCVSLARKILELAGVGGTKLASVSVQAELVVREGKEREFKRQILSQRPHRV